MRYRDVVDLEGIFQYHFAYACCSKTSIDASEWLKILDRVESGK